jgi:hypothetical protein
MHMSKLGSRDCRSVAGKFVCSSDFNLQQMEMSLLLLMNHKSKLQTNLSIPMMGGVGKRGAGGGGDHEESPLSNWEARKEEAGKEEIERER